MTTPLVSVVMPVKDGMRYISESLTMLRAQGIKEMEIIVIDDGSVDGTGDYARSVGCIVQRNEKSQGPVKAKNAGLKIAKGKYLMFHDHDDKMREGALLQLLNELENDTTIMAVRGKSLDFISPDISPDQAKRISKKDTGYYGLFSGTTLMRRSIWDKLLQFDESVQAGDFHDWFTRMQENSFQIKSLDFIASDRRLHMTNFGRTNRTTEYADYAKLLRQRLLKKVQCA